MSSIELKSIWEPIVRRGRHGGWRSDLLISHWNRNAPHLIVAFNINGGQVKRSSRHNLHPTYLAADYRPHLTTQKPP